MNIFSKMKEYDYEELVFCQDKSTGLKAIIAIHDTTLAKIMVPGTTSKLIFMQ